jgi:hypothetical protein
LGWAIDTLVSLVSVVGVGAFLGTVRVPFVWYLGWVNFRDFATNVVEQALLKLAKDSVGCPTDIPKGEDDVPDCDERVYGVVKPSSLLSSANSIVGVILALTMPLMGAWVDKM